MNKLKRLCAINDISCFGKCSLTVAVPVINAFGIEVSVLPTALLSAHTGFSGSTFLDLSEEMEKIITHFDELNVRFDCLYSGFIASGQQIDIVKDFFKSNASALKIADPVMGDNGKPYKTYTKEMCTKIKSLVHLADITTPNYTEACFLLDKPYASPTETVIKSYLKEISDLGPRFVIITGVHMDNQMYTFAYDKKTGEHFSFNSPLLPCSLSGSGDLFCSIVAGCFLDNYTYKQAVQMAFYYTYDCIKRTLETDSQNILFEEKLYTFSANRLRNNTSF